LAGATGFARKKGGNTAATELGIWEPIMRRESLRTAEYREFVTELKARVLSARISAARAVNRDLILLYWDLGRAIVDRQARHAWGDGIIEILAMDLRQTFPCKFGLDFCKL
jgi:hypothetical protein